MLSDEGMRLVLGILSRLIPSLFFHIHTTSLFFHSLFNFPKALTISEINTGQKMGFSIKDFFSKCDQIRRKLVTFTAEILNGKNHFLYSEKNCLKPHKKTIDEKQPEKQRKKNQKQKQPPEVFCKKRCLYKFCKILRKTPMPESLF